MAEEVQACPTSGSVPETSNGTAPDKSLPVDNDKLLKDAMNYIVCGKRHLLVHDYTSAVTSLEEATRLFDQIYGTGADECGEAYLYYGIASLELSRQETGALDGVISANIHEPSDEEEEGDDDDDDEQPEGEEAGVPQTENSPMAEADVERAQTDEDLDELPAQAAAPGGSGSGVAAGSSAGGSGTPAEPVAGTSSGEVAEEAEEDAEASTAEIAWEVLGLAREVFMRQLHKGTEMKLKLAEALEKLGEISIEWENYENAIDILQESLSLRKECLPSDDRLVAETYYHIGVSFSFKNECDKANDCFRSAISIIEQRIENLKKSISSENGYSEEKSQKEVEVIELEGLLPELHVKIEDSRDQMVNATEALKEEAQQELKEQEVVAKINDAQEKPVNNISHLVKRKRNDSGQDKSPKKLCPGGDAPTNGTTTA